MFTTTKRLLKPPSNPIFIGWGKGVRNVIRFDKKIFAFVAEDGRLIAPRLDSDGWDFFFVNSPKDENAEARFCSGEGYWAFPFSKEKIQKILEKYEDILEAMLKTESTGDHDMDSAIKALRQYFYVK